MIVTAEVIRPPSRMGYTTTPPNKWFVVPFVAGEGMEDFLVRAEQIVAVNNCRPETLSVCALNQETEFYEVFYDRMFAGKSDWPAWSSLMAAEPLGNP